jgi:hypothetical protein
VNSLIKPNLFIPGFSKAGTTALISYLSQHKDIFVPWRKEPHTLYLNNSFPLFATKGRFEDHILDYNSYIKLYSNAKDYLYRVDGSTSYTFYSDNAYKIKEFNNDAKIIICIREQRPRLVSAYLFTYPNHKISNFNHWIDKYFINEINTFLFYDKVKTYYNVFGDNLRIIDNNDLKNEAQYIMDMIFNFLNLEPIKIDIVYRNPSMVTPYDNVLYRYLIFIAYPIVVELLNFSRVVGLEKLGRDIINNLRYKSSKGFIEKKAKSSNNKLFIDMIPNNIKDILDNDYNSTLKFAKDNNILLEAKNKTTYNRY